MTILQRLVEASKYVISKCDHPDDEGCVACDNLSDLLPAAEAELRHREECKHGKVVNGRYVNRAWVARAFVRYTTPYCPDCGERLGGKNG